MRIKQQYESIKNKILTTTERLKTKFYKNLEKAKQIIKQYNEKLKIINTIIRTKRR